MRRFFKRATGALLVVGLVPAFLVESGGISSPAKARRNVRPNVLIIVTDDQREGLQVMKTVRRRFDRGGRSYPGAFVTTPLCCPSRASILTGRYTHNHGVTSNNTSQIASPQTMLQYYLQRRGYRTGIFGKFLNGWGPHTSPPYFSKWALLAPRDGGNSFYEDSTYNVNGDLRKIPGYSTDVLGRKATRFLRDSDKQSDRKPWMLYMAPPAPHSPYKAEAQYRDAAVPDWEGNPGVFETDRSDKPPYVQDRSMPFKQGRRIRKRQFRTLMSVDDMVKRIFRTIRLQNERNTLAFFVSDNGIMWAEHGIGGKTVPYTESVAAPLLARWPGHLEGGSSDDRIVANIDIMPTVLDAAGLTPADPSYDGRSLLDSDWERDRILLEFPTPRKNIPAWASTRTSSYQYVEYYDEQGNVSFKEYYDLEADPWQLENLYGNDDPTDDPLDGELLRLQLESDKSCQEQDCP